MAMFKIVAAEQLRLLYLAVLLGSFFRVLPANPANACGRDLHVRVVLAHHSLVLTALSAAILLQLVRTAVSSAEAAFIAAARAAAAAAGAKAFHAKHVAADTAVKGVGCIAAKWHMVSVRALLLVAVALSLAAWLLAVVTIEDGFLYVSGCGSDDAGYGVGSPTGVVMTVTMALLHGCAAWVAVRED